MQLIEVTNGGNGLVANLARALEQNPNGGIHLRLPPGRVDLTPVHAREQLIFPSNNDSGLVKVGCLLDRVSDVVIEGQETELVIRGEPLAGRGYTCQMHEPLLPFIVRRCANVTLRGFSIDWQTPFAAQAEVTRADAGALEVKMLSPHKHWVWNGRLFVEGEGWTIPAHRVLAVDAQTGAVLPNSGDNCGQGYELNWVFENASPGTIRMSAPMSVPPPVGSLVIFSLMGFDTVGRRTPAVFVEESRAVSLEDVTLHHARGMGVLAQRSEELALRRLIVTPSGDRRFSLTADATHFVACRGSLTLEDCRCQNQFDDNVNIHGNYWQIVSQLGANRLRTRCGHPQHQNVPSLGPDDEVELSRLSDLEVYGRARVVSLTRLNGEYVDLELDSPLAADAKPGDLIENASWYPDTTIRGCTFRWNRARGMLLSGRGRTVIERTHFTSPGAAIRMECEPMWFESGYVRDVTIRDNTFEDCAHTPAWGESVISIGDGLKRGYDRQTPFHRNVRVVNNAFIRPHGPLVSATLAEGLTITGNTIRDSQAKGPALQLEHCQNVVTDIRA